MDGFYSARGRSIPPLPWPTFAPPFSGGYAGIALMPEIHALDADMLDQPLDRFLALKTCVLTPDMNARQAAQQFEEQSSDALVVVSDRISNRVIGLLSESYVLRRYAEELDKVRMDMSGGSRGSVGAPGGLRK
ncbi:CBS domain-containing protein [Martelella mangrovi]|uniref:CBS domain-containing protein n=1 Tax=Martelella mangrovi TaxID=1397477 RepID=UPI0033925DDE